MGSFGSRAVFFNAVFKKPLKTELLLRRILLSSQNIESLIFHTLLCIFYQMCILDSDV